MNLRSWMVAAAMVAAGLAAARAEVPVTYAGGTQFTISPASNVDVTVDVFNGSGSRLGGGSDTNIPLAGILGLTLWQDGAGGVMIKQARVDELSMQTTRGINMQFGVSIATAKVSSTPVTITDNGPSATVPVGSGGGMTVPNYSVNAAGTVSYDVSYFLGNLAGGSFDMASYNPQTTTLTGSMVREGASLRFTSPLDMAIDYTQTGVPLLGSVVVKTQIHADIEATAPFQTPEPATLLILGLAGAGLVGRRR